MIIALYERWDQNGKVELYSGEKKDIVRITLRVNYRDKFTQDEHGTSFDRRKKVC